MRFNAYYVRFFVYEKATPKSLKPLNLKGSSVFLATSKKWWRWRESNSRPKTFPQEFLRAQPVIYGFAFEYARRQAYKSAIP